MVAISSAPPAQPFWRGLFRPMLLFSLVLHGLLLLVPTSSAPEVQPEVEEEKVSLTQLPSAQTAPAAVPATTRPPVRPSPPQPPPVQPTPQAMLPVQRRAVTPIPPVRSNPAPRPATASPQPTPSAATSSPTAPEPTTTDPQAANNAPPGPPATDPFAAGFPRYPNAVPGSFGLPATYESGSQRTNDAMAQVGAFFERELAGAGYQVTAIDQTGRQAYQVTKDGTTKVLTLIPNAEGAGTSIVLSDAPLPADLGSVTVESPAVLRFYSEIPIPAPDNANWFDMAELALEQSLDELLDTPTAFFSSLGGTDAEGFFLSPEPRAGYNRAVVGNGAPASVFASIQPQLEANQFFVTSVGSYGSGNTYQITRTDQYTSEQVTGYVVVVPTKDGRTAIFLWDRRPS